MINTIETLKECAQLHANRAGWWDKKNDVKQRDLHSRFYGAINEAVLAMTKKVKSDEKPKRAVFAAPTLAELVEYGAEINLPKREAEKFFDWFESNGWKVGGRAMMKDWKSALRNWKRNWLERNPGEARNQKAAQAIKGKESASDPAGWPDWLSSKNLPTMPWSQASGWMKEEFRKWNIEPA